MAVGDRAITRVYLWGLTCLVIGGVVLGCRRDVIGRRPLSDLDKANVAIVQETFVRLRLEQSADPYLARTPKTLERILRRGKLSKAERIIGKKGKHWVGVAWPGGAVILRADQFSDGIANLAYLLIHELAHVNGADEEEALNAEDAFFLLSGFVRGHRRECPGMGT